MYRQPTEQYLKLLAEVETKLSRPAVHATISTHQAFHPGAQQLKRSKTRRHGAVVHSSPENRSAFADAREPPPSSCCPC